MYGFYEKSKIFHPGVDDTEIAATTALNYNEAIAVAKSSWMMIEPTLITRFSIQAITTFAVTTEPVVSLFRKAITGDAIKADDGAGTLAFMTDTSESFTVNQFVGWTIYNLTDGSSAIITSNTATLVYGTLTGGTDNDWDNADKYLIGYKLAEVSIPTLTAIGDVVYADVANVPNIAGTGPSATGLTNYKKRGPAEIYAGEQLVVVATTLGAGSTGTYQPYAIGHPMAEVAPNQTQMTESA